MRLKFYGRIGHEIRRPSPFSWRIRYALAHKQLQPEVIPVAFADVNKIEAISSQRFVPVIEYSGEVVADSWQIAIFLERTFADKPTLFGDPQGQASAHFISRWTDETLHPLIRNLILPEFLGVLHEGDRDYSRASRERVLGHALEECSKDHTHLASDLDRALIPLRKTLRTQAYLAGDTPAYADYIDFGAFQWARLGCPRSIVQRDDEILHTWLRSMRSLHDGLADQFAGYPSG